MTRKFTRSHLYSPVGLQVQKQSALRKLSIEQGGWGVIICKVQRHGLTGLAPSGDEERDTTRARQKQSARVPSCLHKLTIAALISGAVIAENRARKTCCKGFWAAAGFMWRKVQSMTCRACCVCDLIVCIYSSASGNTGEGCIERVQNKGAVLSQYELKLLRAAN